MLESVFNKVAGLQACNLLKRDSNTGVFLLILRNYKNTFFEEHMRTTAFDKTYEVHALFICVYMCVLIFDIFVALRDLVPFVQCKNMKNTHGGVLVLVGCRLQAEA